VPLPKESIYIKSRWLYSIKTDIFGNINRYKARFIAQGYNQREGIDFDCKYSPVVKIETFRMVLSLLIEKDLHYSIIDIKTAYLYSKIDKEIYLQQPKGFTVYDTDKLYLKLKKGLYGLVQSAKLWYDELKSTLIAIGFTVSLNDSGLFYIFKNGEFCFLTVWVDDILICSGDIKLQEAIIEDLKKKYTVKIEENADSILGISLNFSKGQLKMAQVNLIQNVIAKSYIDDEKTYFTPMVPNLNLDCRELNEETLKIPYQALVGSLLYLASRTRPDISYSVNYLSRFCNSYGKEHYEELLRIVRYLKRTISDQFTYTKSDTEKIVLKAYSDASFANEKEHKSTTGYLIYLNDNLILWRTCKQKLVVTSTAESEIIAAVQCVQDIIWIGNMLNELNIEVKKPYELYEDNKAVIAIANTGMITARTKHLGAKTSFLKENVFIILSPI
jgi:hypothetical protein